MEHELFEKIKNIKPDVTKLVEFGFIFKDGIYLYEKTIADNNLMLSGEKRMDG